MKICFGAVLFLLCTPLIFGCVTHSSQDPNLNRVPAGVKSDAATTSLVQGSVVIVVGDKNYSVVEAVQGQDITVRNSNSGARATVANSKVAFAWGCFGSHYCVGNLVIRLGDKNLCRIEGVQPDAGIVVRNSNSGERYFIKGADVALASGCSDDGAYCTGDVGIVYGEKNYSVIEGFYPDSRAVIVRNSNTEANRIVDAKALTIVSRARK